MLNEDSKVENPKNPRPIKYIDADKLIAEIERRKEQPGITFRERNILVDIETSIALLRADMIISSLQQEQPDAYENAMLEVKEYVDKLYDEEVGIGLCEYDSGLFDGIGKICTQLRGFIKVRISLHHTQPESELEKAARYVYESWMGGTMDDVRRDIDELGKVLNARKNA